VRLRYLAVFMVIVLISLSACSGAYPTAELGQAFTLSPGDSVRIPGEDMTVTFDEVSGDSRCPQNVTCVWEGIATAKVSIVLHGVKSTIELNQPGFTEQSTTTFSNYTLTHSLNPYPKEGQEISPSDYRLTLKITK
jgi:hypothetical protein